MQEREIVVVGGGMAALTAGLFAARAGRRTAVLAGPTIGGHLMTIPRIEDFPGFPEGVAGYDLCPMLEEQATAAGADIRCTEVEQVEFDGDHWLIRTSDDELRAESVIVATGSRLKHLDVPGEDTLFGKGVSHCASCDGPLLRGRVAAVVGGGDSAAQEALILAEYASSVIIFHDKDDLVGQHVYRSRVAAHPLITVRSSTQLVEIFGDDRVEGVRVRDLVTNVSEAVELAAVFIYVGLQPVTQFLDAVLELDRSGHMRTDASMRTTARGLFAAGDVRHDSARQAVAAAGDGATAAVAADRYLTDRHWPAT